MAARLTDGISLARYIKASPLLNRLFTPVANAYVHATGHRQVGLKYDDLIIEETPVVQKAITRLSQQEAYDRAFRLRRAIQLSILHRELPKEQWTQATEDQRYLTPLIQEIQNEEAERAAWDTVKVKK